MTGLHERTAARLVRHDRVVQAALAMVAAQLLFRAWATYGAWFFGDDFAFISRMNNLGLAPGVAARPYAGHVMPAGMYLTWLTDLVAPFDFRVPATVLLAMQALADAGLLVLLLRLFGARRGILPPLALYLFCAISMPIAIWWAAGVNQLPMQVVWFWALACHVSYLRRGRVRHAVHACLWLLAGLAFYEKTLLVVGGLALFSLCYFARGSLPARVRWLWQRYRAGIVLYAVISCGYLAGYVVVGLNFSPARANNDALPQVVSNMVVHAWAAAMAGGPLHWQYFQQGAVPQPNILVALAGVALVVLVAREIRRCRTRSLRAWLLPGFFLGSSILLVTAGRVSFVGAQISLDYRYQGELAAVTAVALGCAVLPIRGAVECAEPRAASELLDHPSRVAALVSVVSVLATVSSAQYAVHWQDANIARPYFSHLLGDLEQAPAPVPLIDDAVPDTIMWPIGYPLNLQSYLLRDFRDRTDFTEIATDRLSMVDGHGHVEPAVVPVARRAPTGPHGSCGYRIRASGRTIPLNGPVAYGGWWVRIGYLASAASPVRVVAGDAAYTTTVQPGVHALYLRGGIQFDQVRISGLGENVTVCTNDVTVGRPVPRTEFHP
ncbi:hypothetical protein [Nocardioides panaciterrulae]|uniref:Uncharacterized protein n=1 Tax=Nocardioides panaciterrulae TaxID=661492 RepID=A0A7Y9E647_9ACTN|nr:hypothetical protein [Nocardioides panaciterrulae]